MRAEGPLANLVKRGEILCSADKCGRSRHEAVCPRCGYVHCLIRIGWKGKTYRLYSGKWGRPFQYSDALTVLIAINADIKDGKFKPEDWTKKTIEKRKFSSVYDQWLKDKEQLIREGEFAPATLKAYECYRRAHMQKLEDQNMAEIGDADIKEFKRNLPVSLSRKYKRNIINALRALFNWAKEELIIDSVPEFPKWRKENKVKQRAATYDDQIKYIKKLPEMHGDIHKIMQKFALREGEACVVQCRDFEPNPSTRKGRILIQRTLSAGVMHETTKGRRGDWLPVEGEAYDIMERLTENKFGLEYMFINPKTRRGYRTNYLRKLWLTYGKPGWPHLTLYEMMRATTITEWAREGKNAFQIMSSARHADVKTSEGYVRLSGRDIADVINYRDNVHELPENDGSEYHPTRSRKPRQGMD